MKRLLQTCLIAAPVFSLPLHGDNEYLHQFVLLNDGRVMAQLGDGTTVFSENCGRDWTRRSKACSFRDLISIDQNEYWGFASSVEGALAHTIDAGESWTVTRFPAYQLHPAGFIGVDDGMPVLIDYCGQVWKARQDAVGPTTDPSNWTRVGRTNPDKEGGGGLMVGSHIYVGCSARIWHSSDSGQSWNPFSANVDSWFSHFVLAGSNCYVSTGQGEVYSATIGSNDWSKICEVPDVFYTTCLAASTKGLYHAGELDVRRAVVHFIDYEGRLTMLPPFPRGRAEMVGVDADGAVWVAASGGLYRLEGEEQTRLWPIESDG